MSSNKDFQKLIKEAESQGWEVNRTGGGHLRWVAPDGRVVFSAFSPSDKRALQNTRKELRIKGFVVIQQKKGK